jgi:hypothetical protein
MILHNIRKYFFFIFFLFFLINIFNISQVNKEFNNYVFNEDKIIEHKIIKGDSLKYWNIASELEKNFFSFPFQYRNAQLYPKIIYLYSKLTNQKLFDDKGNAVLEKKLNIFYFQLIFYYFALVLLYKSLARKINTNGLPELIILALSIDPFINQVHHAIFAESIFITLLIIFISFFIKLNARSLKSFFYLGLLLGILFMQRTVAFYYIFFLIPLFIFFYKDQRIKNLLSLIIGYLIVLLFIGISSYNSLGTVRITPTQTDDAIFGYLAPNVYAKQKDISISESKKIFFGNKVNNFVVSNNLNLNNFEDIQLLLNYQKTYGYEILINDPVNTIKVLIYNYSKNLFIHYNWVTELFNSSGKKNEQNIQTVNRDKNSFIMRGIYSLIFFFITLVGLIYSFKVFDKKIISFLFFSSIYFYIVSGWIGNPRYFLPSYVFSIFFFSIGIFFILKKLSKEKFT